MAEDGSMRIRATAPCRVDFAGGTLDMAQVPALLGGATTVNAAISVVATATLKTRADMRVLLRSVDQGAKRAFDDLAAVTTAIRAGDLGPLDLSARALVVARPGCGLELTTCAQAPKGSGLGGSSTLLVTIMATLHALTNPEGATTPISPTQAVAFAQHATAIEAWQLGVPTGTQDHIAAIMGGILAIDYGLAATTPRRIKVPQDTRRWLDAHLMVVYTGAAHFSGAPNWSVFKRFVDGDADTRARLARLSDIASEVAKALESGQTDLFSQLIDGEWSLRRGLADGVSTPQLEALMATCKEAGALASKACGAGGGGSVLMLVPPDRRAAVASCAEAQGATVLDAQLREKGLEIETYER